MSLHPTFCDFGPYRSRKVLSWCLTRAGTPEPLIGCLDRPHWMPAGACAHVDDPDGEFTGQQIEILLL